MVISDGDWGGGGAKVVVVEWWGGGGGVVLGSNQSLTGCLVSGP